MRICCFSSFSLADAGRARVLAETLRRVHPDWEVWGVLVDGPGVVDGFDGVLGVEELGIPRLRNWLFRHDMRAACAAVKGRALLHLLERGADGVVYFDPSVAVFNRLDPVEDGFSRASVLLSPQQIVPAGSAADMVARERPALLRGAFNLGFLGVRNDAEGRRFASWWTGMLAAGCVDDPEAGFFLDQKYCDLVPGMFSPVRVLRDAGWHVGAWNVLTRGLRFDAAGMLTAGDAPVRFVQFGGEPAGGIEAYELWAWHRRRVAAVGGAGEWAFARFANGAAISAGVRALFRSRDDLVAAFEDPFAVGAGSFWGWLGRERGDLLEG